MRLKLGNEIEFETITSDIMVEYKSQKLLPITVKTRVEATPFFQNLSCQTESEAYLQMLLIHRCL